MRRNASPADRERIRRTLSMVLEVLSGLGVPGAGIARTVVEETARALEHGETQRKLAEALRQAEEDFREEAQRRGWHEAADLILQLPIHDLPSFRKALQAALQEGESEELAQALEQALSPSPLSPPERAEAALLYARCVWARLWGEPAFRAPVRDILFRDHVALLEDVSARLDRLVEALPGRVVDEQERRARQRAWRALRPAVLPPPERLTPENLLESLKAPYRLVAFTGAAPEALRDEVVRALAGLAPAETRAWVLWGPGGIGKTRVAVEVARALEGKGWQAFFVPRAAEVPAWPEALHHWSRPERPTLLIVDYAEQRTGEELEALAQAVRAAAAERRSPLALLFLMRADPEEPVAGHVTGALKGADLRYDARPVPPLRAPEEREALFRQARQLFRERLAPPEAPPGVEYPPEALPETPLALLALAVLAAFGHRVAQSRDEVAVLTDLWERWEQPRWRRTLEAQGGADLLRTPEVWAEARERIEQALAAATLGRPFSSPEAVAAWWQAHYPFRARTARGETLDPLWL
ncbi:MAG TPA: hypothetical protein VNK89_09225, partial [Thermoflexus sp.]|nr:hypothetical protein [Thermoflexus sp.]